MNQLARALGILKSQMFNHTRSPTSNSMCHQILLVCLSYFACAFFKSFLAYVFVFVCFLTISNSTYLPPFQQTLPILGMAEFMCYFASTPNANSKGLILVVECMVELQ
jgi:hypothetical protein